MALKYFVTAKGTFVIRLIQPVHFVMTELCEKIKRSNHNILINVAKISL